MKSEWISGTIESSSSEVNESPNSVKSCNYSGSQKARSFVASTCSGGGDPISVEMSKVKDRYAGESLRALPNSQQLIDDVKPDDRTQIEDEMYLINRLLKYKHPNTKRSKDEDQPRSNDRLTVENDSCFDRYDTEDSRHSFFVDGDSDGDDGSSTSSWLLGTDEIITGRRSRPSPEKLVAAATTAVKGRKKRSRKKRNPALGCNKSIARLRGRHSTVNGNLAKKLPLSLLPPSPQPFEFVINSSKYFVDSSWVPTRQQRRQQIKDVYAAPEENNRTLAMARRTTDRSHEASSFINRKMGNREITRINKIIADKILNVRTTIPKTKK